MEVPSEIDGIEVSSITGNCFIRRDYITEVIIPDGIRTIGSGVFDSCTNLISVSIPDSAVEVGANPFSHCENLETIIVSPTHPVLGVINGVLYSKLEKKIICYPAGLEDQDYVVPQGMHIIGEKAFMVCNNLKSVTIPDTVFGIERDAFYGCKKLQRVTIPDSISHIRDYALDGCPDLKVYISNNS